ncbi:hypothetical protein [Burkholderia lata]|uniref:hypothetical protein n=1 Tax=Burkholderia lata (strain ATCC 17760 / DSM 23089 / LMG 22485 / NCIMB 9086 / R18194 / 383) TaxID=482957 RepID=UPI001582E275|nr:hypothetical protein [Burkholderia lata]
MRHPYIQAAGRLEGKARYVAVVLTVVVVGATIVWTCSRELSRQFLAAERSPNIVIPPGYKVQIDGRAALVSGHDRCPTDSNPSVNFWIGGRPNGDLRPTTGCVVVAPSADSVRVQVGARGALADETWRIEHRERDGLPVTLVRRPNGDLVVPAAN